MKKLFLINAFAALAIACSVFGSNADSITKTAETNAQNNEQILEAQTDGYCLNKRDKNALGLGGFTIPNKPDIGPFPDRPMPVVLPKIYENFARDHYNDYSYTPQFIKSMGIIMGKLVIHTEDERDETGVDRIDNDWYRFSITERFNYDFSFTAPNSSYYYEVFKFSSMDADRPDIERNHTLLHSSLNGNSSYNALLECGTYFVHVTALNEASISDTQYSVTMQRNTNFPGTLSSFRLTRENLGENRVILWENENTPSGVNSWAKQENELAYYKYEPVGTNIIHFDGYVDPIFMYNKEWLPAYPTMRLDETTYLDSIIYISGDDNIRDVRNIIDKILNEASIAEYEQDIESMRMEATISAWDAVRGVVEIIIAVYISPHLAGAMEVLYNTITTTISCIETANALCEALSFSAGHDHYVTPGDIRENLRNLYERCNEILNYHPNFVLKIPRYSYLCEEIVPLNNPEMYPAGTRASTWVTSMFLPSPYRFDDSYFFEGIGATVNRVQTYTDSDGTRSFKGSIKLFENLQDMWEETVPVVESSSTVTDSDCRLCYKFSRRADNKYYLTVHNTNQTAVDITYNNASASDNDGQYFNLKADDYVNARVERGNPVRICTEKRNYIWVRENSNEHVKKITFSSGVTHLSQKYNFHMTNLKLAIVGFSNGVWTIRVRNLSNLGVHFYYNSKMCFYDDAKYWRNLVDWQNHSSVYINYNEYADIQISMNWFADSIAVSYVMNNVRYVSFANQLNNDNKTLNYSENLIYAQ